MRGGKIDRSIEICEIGCGCGQFANMLFDNGYTKYIGIDFSSQAIMLARKANPDHAEQFICEDAFSYLQSCQEKSGTLFIMFEVLEHIKKDIELLNMLPVGSNVIFSVPNFKSFNHIRTYDTLEFIENRYKMLKIRNYHELPANKNADKIYHLLHAVRI